MKKIWIYTIVFCHEDDEYGHDVYHGQLTEVFETKESAEKYKKDFEDPKNLEYISGTYFDDCSLYDWYWGASGRFYSDIQEKEIMDY